jgi:hypothetical protein
MTAEHNDIRTLVEIAHYEAHPDRKDSKEFTQIKRKHKAEQRKCYINNGFCEGGIEVHHSIIELSAAYGVDWEKVKVDYPNLDHADDDDQMMDLCTRHHRGKYTGIHNMSYNIWILQKYMNQEALEDFENAVQEQLKKDEMKREGNKSLPTKFNEV